MTNKSFNKYNFHKHTFCIFEEVALDTIKDNQPNFKSKSGSSYYFVENGVYRLSNHWSRVANCRWRLNKMEHVSKNKINLGFAKWTDFYQDNDFENLYFIEINEKNEVNYFHKDEANYNNQILRTASETIKLVKQSRQLLTQTSWANYLKHNSKTDLVTEVVKKTINTNQTFQEIRQAYF